MLSGGMRVIVALVTLAAGLARPALAASVAATPGLQLSVATDGALEIRHGADLVGRLDPKTPSLRRGTPVLRELSVAGHRLAELRIPIRGTPGEEVWIG